MKWNRAQIKHLCAVLNQLATLPTLVVVVKNLYLYKTDRPLETGLLAAVLSVYALAQLAIFKIRGRLTRAEVSQRQEASWISRHFDRPGSQLTERLKAWWDSMFAHYDPTVKFALKVALIGGVIGFMLILWAVLLRTSE